MPMRRLALALIAAAIALLTAGCGLGTIASSTIDIPAMHGNVHGGQQPVNNAHVFLYAVNQTTYAGASTSRLSGLGFALSDANGNFNMTAQNTCQAGDIMYAAVAGGNPGLTVGTFNNALTMMTVLGPCSSLTPSTVIMINEVTTVAAVYALAPFMSDVSHVGTSATNLAGLNAAIATAKNLVSGNGYALTTTTNGAGTVPQAEINSIANSLSNCINSNGSDFHCANLYTATTPAGGTAANNVVSALLNLIQGPYNFTNIQNFYNQAPASAPFQPSLSAVPNDWSISIIYSGFSTPKGIAVDASGNLWVANSGTNTIAEINNLGVPLSGTGFTGGGLNNPVSLAFDSAGNLWATNSSGNSLSEFSSTGTPISTTGFTGGGINGPNSVAIDATDQLWVTDFGNGTLSKFASSGTPISPGQGYFGVSGPSSIAVDSNGLVWDANIGDNSVNRTANDASSTTNFAGLGVQGPAAIAIGANNNVWVAGRSNSVFVRLNSSGVVQATYNNTNAAFPSYLAIDGAGNAWAANSFIGYVTSIFLANGSNNEYQPGSGYSTPGGIAVDQSGNVWLADAGGNHIDQFVGAATPTVNPISFASRNNKIATRP